ncbi:MAG: hypothetical protein A2V66_17280 [Ignavibacteria bacterium RBG_13_36_8]|nr:MAG: hypothetical protein A2V66_17280 [Ignavibacteria bacterium RBG_13_36_8]
MKVLIVHAHPEPKSFCSSLKNEAVKFFEENNHEVKVSDLYKMGFNPVGDKYDFKELSNKEFFKYQAEQMNAYKENLFSNELTAEMDKFMWADAINFNFPLWWFSVPAILKGWVDRVFAMGFAYGAGKGVYDTGAFKGKKGFLTLTTGGPENSYGKNGRNGEMGTILFHINHGMLYFVGMDVLPPFIVYGATRISDEERKQHLVNYRNYLSNIHSHNKLY